MAGEISLTATGPDLGRPGRDPDGLVEAYRSSTARGSFCGATGYDEFIDESGDVRPAWQEVAAYLGGRGGEGLDRLRGAVRRLVDNDGITYIGVDPYTEATATTEATAAGSEVAAPGRWNLDGIPLLVAASDWDVLEAGVVQRSRLLDAILDDLYGERRSLTAGILPPRLLFGHPGYLRAVQGVVNPGRHQLFMHGCDLSRGADGQFKVNADRTQAPSGAGYALADRRVVARAVPELYERIAPRPASPFAQALRLALIDAAPAAAEDPMVVVLSPGIHSETAFDQAYLATVLGFPLVESADLVVRDGKLWMRSLGSLKRVDVVLRRVDAEYADPLDLRPDSRLGVVGLVEVARRGAVTVVNTLGSGVLESPGLQRFLPEMANYLLGESPLLDSPQLYWGGIDAERSHLLARMSSLLITSTVGGRTAVGPALSEVQRATLAARIESEPWQWVGQELPEFSSGPTGRNRDGLSPAGVGMRIFTVSQRNGYAAMVGGLGYVLAPGPAAFRLKSVAAKDIWILQHARSGDEQTQTIPSIELPSGMEFTSSPRVLSDLFWIGRYSERAEGLARLLVVTRERYHEYRYRQHTPASQCVPVLVAALSRISSDGGPDDPGDGETPAIGAVPQLLWSLTADRSRSGSLAHSAEHLGLAARAVRDQMSNDTWMVLGAVERALAEQAESPLGAQRRLDDTGLAAAQQVTLSGMLALSGLTAESMVHDAGWMLMDIGKRIERSLALVTLLGAALTNERHPEAERTITESALVACESSVVYRRLNLGRVSVAAVADLVLFDAANPRSLIYQLDRLRSNLRAIPGASGSSRAERVVEEISARLRRLDPDELEEVDKDGRRATLAGLLSAAHTALREVSEILTRTQLSLPGDMQPIWGPNQRRELP